MVGSWTCNRYGRKMTMLAGGLCFLIGTALVAAAVALPMLVIGRIVLGFGVGFACQVRRQPAAATALIARLDRGGCAPRGRVACAHFGRSSSRRPAPSPSN
jgi:MFS family permease